MHNWLIGRRRNPTENASGCMPRYCEPALSHIWQDTHNINAKSEPWYPLQNQYLCFGTFFSAFYVKPWDCDHWHSDSCRSWKRILQIYAELERLLSTILWTTIHASLVEYLLLRWISTSISHMASFLVLQLQSRNLLASSAEFRINRPIQHSCIEGTNQTSEYMYTAVSFSETEQARKHLYIIIQQRAQRGERGECCV